MAFSSQEILEEFQESTSPGESSWLQQCAISLARRRRSGRLSYARWIARYRNQLKKLAYMRLYDRTPARMASKNASGKARRLAYRLANPLVQRDCKYKKGCKRVESKATRHERYLRACATGYLSGKCSGSGGK